MAGSIQKSESQLIRRLGEMLRRGPATPIPFGDDMAGVAFGGTTLLMTTDMINEGVDFLPGEHPWRQVGYKAMAVNLSDCAAMAAVPVAALAAVALNDAMSMQDAEELMRGMIECSERFHCPLVGGDTNSWASPVAVAVTVVARPDDHPDAAPPVRRDGARPGDRLCVSGPLGGSLLSRHVRPEPRIETALAVNRTLKPHAMIDISDGLAIDLWRICEASGCGAVIHEAALDGVIHPDAVKLSRQDSVPPRVHALFDGEDFELIMALPADATDDAVGRLGLTCIGEFTTEGGCVLKAADGAVKPLPRRGWEHFR